MDLSHIPPVHIVSAPLNNDVLFQQQSLLFYGSYEQQWFLSSDECFTLVWHFCVYSNYTNCFTLYNHVCVTAQTPQPVVHFINIRWDYIHLLWSISNDMELKGSECFVCFTYQQLRCFIKDILPIYTHTQTKTVQCTLAHGLILLNSVEKCGNSKERLLDGELLFSFYLRQKTGNNAAISS